MARVFLTGATGFMGQRLARSLASRGHRLRMLVRPGSESRAPREAGEVIVADPLDASSYAAKLGDADTFVHLIGTAHPAPWKGDEFRAVDLRSGLAAIEAARQSPPIRHFVYVSVAQPAPVMKAYIAVRAEVEAALAASGLPHTILRPWYVLGPGRRWPAMMKPLYWIFSRFESTRAGAARTGLLEESEMLNALVWAVENPNREGARILEVPQIRKIGFVN